MIKASSISESEVCETPYFPGGYNHHGVFYAALFKYDFPLVEYFFLK